MGFYFFCAGLLMFLFGFHLATKKYLNPYKLVFIFGKKGSGKSTLLTKKIYEAKMAGRPVYANFPVPGAHLIESVRDTVGYYAFEPGAVVFLDECGTIYDNRLFKSFKPAERDYFKLQRHYQNTVYMSSQSFDIDLKLRELTDEMYLVRKMFRVFSVARRIDRHITITQPGPDAPSTLQDSLEFAPLFSPRAVQITFIPRWAGLFDSFAAPELPAVDAPLMPDRDFTPRTVFRDWVVGKWQFAQSKVLSWGARFVHNDEEVKPCESLEELFAPLDE